MYIILSRFLPGVSRRLTVLASGASLAVPVPSGSLVCVIFS